LAAQLIKGTDASALYFRARRQRQDVRCLGEIRDALAADPDGPTLLLIAPKQTTYQLERQLLTDSR